MGFSVTRLLGEGGGGPGVSTGNLGVGGGGAKAPFTAKTSPLFGENALVLTSWGDLGSELGQIQVEIGSERGSKYGPGGVGFGVGVIRPEWLCSPERARG